MVYIAAISILLNALLLALLAKSYKEIDGYKVMLRMILKEIEELHQSLAEEMEKEIRESERESTDEVSGIEEGK